MNVLDLTADVPELPDVIPVQKARQTPGMDPDPAKLKPAQHASFKHNLAQWTIDLTCHSNIGPTADGVFERSR